MKVFLYAMKKTPLSIVFFLGLLLFHFFLMPSSLPCQISFITEKDTTEQSQYDELLKKARGIDYATQCARNAVKAFADSAILPDLLSQLSEWEIQREKSHFDLAMMQYDQQFQLYQQGKLNQEPSEPILKFEEALKINQKIIKDYPDVPFINKVFYRTGYCLFEVGKRDSAKQLFLKAKNQSVDSTYYNDLLFRLGECFFDEGDYEQAINAYKPILDNWKSPFFAMALYKIGWCHYRLDRYSDAISAFFYLLNDINHLENINSDLVGISQVQLKNEIMEYIAISFSDFGGAASLLNFTESMGGSFYTPFFLHKLANIYLKRDFYEDALNALNLLLNKFPSYERLPEIFVVFFECYETMGNMNKAYKLYDEFIAYCGSNSKWSRLNNNPAAQQIFNSTLKEMDYKIATRSLSTADSLYAIRNYKKAVEKYSYFLKIFKNDERRDHASFYLGECYFSLLDYDKAATAYKNIVVNIPKSQLLEDAAYNYIVCCDKILERSNVSLDDSSVSIKQTPELKNLIVACHNFLKCCPSSNKEPEIKLKLGEIFYRKDMYDQAEKYAKSALDLIMNDKKGLEYKTNALNLLAQINFKQGKFGEAELYSNMLIKENPNSAELVEKSKKMLASTSFKIGEQLKSKGQNEQAAWKFEQAALKSTDPNITEASLFEAAIQYEHAQEFNRAALKFEEFYNKYPRSEHVKEAIYRAALLREKLQQYQLAARNYLLLYDLTSNTPEGSAALLSASTVYEKDRDWHSMAETLKRYVEKYSTDYDHLLEAIFKIGYAYEQSGMSQQATLEYKKLMNQYDQLKASGKFADDYYAAETMFRLAEMEHDNFKAIALNPPLEVNLKRKQTKFNDLLKSYVDVAKFNIAEWSTAAFYRLGLAYEEFCQDILFSPEPPNLKGEDLETYWTTIKEQWVIPLQKEALKYYQTNEKLAEENNLTNEWIDKTKARILFLNKRLAKESNNISTNPQLKEVNAAAKPPATQEKE